MDSSHACFKVRHFWPTQRGPQAAIVTEQEKVMKDVGLSLMGLGPGIAD